MYDELFKKYHNELFTENTLLFLKKKENENNIRFKGRSNIITSNEVKELYKLLHKDYHSLNITISFYGTRLSTALGYLSIALNSPIQTNESMEESFKVHIVGKINVFTFNSSFKSVIGRRLYIAFVLFHELRHSYQFKYMRKKYIKASSNYIPKGKGYATQWIEKDANMFAQRMMNKHHDTINEILKIDVNWRCEWGRFKILSD